MNLERLFNMVLRRLVNRGITGGIRAASRRGQTPQNEMTPEERSKSRQGQDMVRNVRNVNRFTRRFGKY